MVRLTRVMGVRLRHFPVSNRVIHFRSAGSTSSRAAFCSAARSRASPVGGGFKESGFVRGAALVRTSHLPALRCGFLVNLRLQERDYDAPLPVQLVESG